MRDFVICKICNSEVGMKGVPQHLKKHKMDYKQYIKENIDDFPNWSECTECGKLVKNGKRCSKKCDKKWRQSLVGEKSPRWGTTLSDESKKRLSNTQKKRLSNPEHHHMYGKTHTLSTKKQMSQTRINRNLSVGENNGMYGKTHSAETVKKIFEYRKMNKLEKQFSEILDDLGLEYIFQFFINEDGIGKSYDFKIKGKDIIFEVDGDFWHGNPKQKNHWKDVNKVRENDSLKENIAIGKGYIVYRFWESDIKNNVDAVINKLKSIFILE